VSTPLSRARTVALTYALLSAMYVAMICLLASSIWTGSWLRLRYDLFEAPYGVGGSVVAVAAANALMAVLMFWYLTLSRSLRVLTLMLSVAFSVMALASAASAVLHRYAIDAPVSIPLLLTAKGLLALGYCLCTYSIYRLGSVASNNRWRGP
jgi:hypothetical protein